MYDEALKIDPKDATYYNKGRIINNIKITNRLIVAYFKQI